MKGKNLKRNLLPNQSPQSPQSPLLTSSLYALLFASIASMEIHSPLLNTFNSVEWPKQISPYNTDTILNKKRLEKRKTSVWVFIISWSDTIRTNIKEEKYE